MKKVLKLAGEGTEGATIADSSIRLVVEDYWRKLGYPGALRDDGRRPKSVSDFTVHHTDSPLGKKLQQSERVI